MNEYRYFDNKRNLVATISATSIIEADGVLKTQGVDPLKLSTCIGGRLAFIDITTGRTAVIQKAGSFVLNTPTGKSAVRQEVITITIKPKDIFGMSYYGTSLCDALRKHEKLIKIYRYAPHIQIQWVCGGLTMIVKEFDVYSK